MSRASLVLIAPLAVVDQARAMALCLGVKAGITVPLSANGQSPATHYGACTYVGPGWEAILTGQVTPEVDGVTEAEINALRAQLIVDVSDGQCERPHFEAVISAQGLQVVEEQS